MPERITFVGGRKFNTNELNNQKRVSELFYHAFIHPGKYNEYTLSKKLGHSGNWAHGTIKDYDLIKREYIEIKKSHINGRSKNILYGKVNPLINRLYQQKFPLDDFDEYVLRDKLDSPLFRPFVKEQGYLSFGFNNSIDYILFLFDFLIVLLEEKGLFDSKGIETIEQYDQRKESAEESFLVFPEKILNNLIQNSDVKELFKVVRGFNKVLSKID
ncbi:hypothetical protein MBGDF03_00148 [Thermoplasmatales archaeon SCGC AB-540-F20]|nr:hypothetical protein MBGDF03_00148 [Thermoplasmatales archaeon SCGC AB-540-F20]